MIPLNLTNCQRVSAGNSVSFESFTMAEFQLISAGICSFTGAFLAAFIPTGKMHLNIFVGMLSGGVLGPLIPIYIQAAASG